MTTLHRVGRPVYFWHHYILWSAGENGYEAESKLAVVRTVQ